VDGDEGCGSARPTAPAPVAAWQAALGAYWTPRSSVEGEEKTSSPPVCGAGVLGPSGTNVRAYLAYSRPTRASARTQTRSGAYARGIGVWFKRRRPLG
jgi:hypothetical protein